MRATILGSLIAAACGGGDAGGTTSGPPKLANSPIPTVTAREGTAIVCAPASPGVLPEDFPADVSVPPDFIVSTVERSPYLRVTGVANPPDDQRAPWIVVSDAVSLPLQAAGWTIALNSRVDGRDETLTAPDGRTLRVVAMPRRGCTTTVDLTYHINWIIG